MFVFDPCKFFNKSKILLTSQMSDAAKKKKKLEVFDLCDLVLVSMELFKNRLLMQNEIYKTIKPLITV